jgi:hypothetical protein
LQELELMTLRDILHRELPAGSEMTGQKKDVLW